MGYEKSINDHFAFQVDATYSLIKSYQGKPFDVFILTPEVRYYTKAVQNGFFVGGHLGGSYFYLQKYNYKNTENVQKGYNYMIGMSVGYAVKLRSKLSLEAYIGGGSIQSFYKGYNYQTGERYDLAKNYNKSGEFLPYRLGFNLGYAL